MSGHLVNFIFAHKFGSWRDKIVAVIAADHVRDDGIAAFPSVDTLAAETQLSREVVRDILERFARNEIIVRVGPGSRDFRFNLAAIARLPVSNPARLA